MKYSYKNLFKTKNGDIVVGQRPNAPILIWFTTLLLSQIPQLDEVQSELLTLSTAALVVWALLELTRGINLFRRLIGAGILGLIILGIIIK